MHINNMNNHNLNSHEIDTKVLALHAAITQEQIRNQLAGINNNNDTMGNSLHHANLIPSSHFAQMMDTAQQNQLQQMPPYLSGQNDCSPFTSQNTFQPMQHQPPAQPLEESHISEEILASLMNLEQLNQIIKNSNEIMGMRDRMMPLIDQQTSVHLFGVRSDSMQDYVTPPPMTPSNSQSPIIRNSNHKRSVSAVTSYHPTLMEELGRMTPDSYLTPPTTPTLQTDAQGRLPLPRLQVSPKDAQKANESGKVILPMYVPIAPHPNGMEMMMTKTSPMLIPSKSRRKSSTSAKDKDKDREKDNIIRRCTNCGDLNTSQWRHDRERQILCNPCGLYLRTHGAHRDISKILARKVDLSLTELCKRMKDVMAIGNGQIGAELEKELMKLDSHELINMTTSLTSCLQIAQRCLDAKNRENSEDNLIN